MDRRLTNLIALVITLVWAASFVADIFMASYEPSPYIHAIMMTVSGAAFAGSVIKRKE